MLKQKEFFMIADSLRNAAILRNAGNVALRGYVLTGLYLYFKKI
jgi:hypothetical protein